ncbi:major facilitator superfamily domain-containing protein [Ilyonectria robusta]|uniref:major facilitator superfamily domain-containing protein n=1 Tax=Ilyonectria robusta TaxID=1079257 RepID=UPI001E8C9DF5|nr:major facilitator superfamily domain-containing protein [Ilyonectria robusta]KAH8679485.1 major facilitator superfamily domain-containing protein [Ilyonectria robusta]
MHLLRPVQKGTLHNTELAKYLVYRNTSSESGTSGTRGIDDHLSSLPLRNAPLTSAARRPSLGVLLASPTPNGRLCNLEAAGCPRNRFPGRPAPTHLCLPAHHLPRAPTIRLLESAICHQHYRHDEPVGDIDESMCKLVPIQAKLARVRGLMSFFDALPVICFGSFFGSFADRKGRRFPFGLACLGIIGGMAWIFFTCHLWNRVPIEVVWFSSLFRLIGGDPNLAIALCLTMASDVSTETTSLSLLCTYPVLLRMPETLSKARQEEEQEVQGGGEAHKAMERTGLASYNKFLKDRRILVGIITVFLAQFRNNTIEILLPYTSIRFGLKLGETATLLSVVSAVNIVVFLVLLPTLTTWLEEKAGWSAHRVNLYVARVSSAMPSAGAAMLAAAGNIGVVVFALIIYAAGFGVRLSIIAVLTAFVSSEKETAKLYSLIATTDAIAHMIASPLLQLVWDKALDIGGRWIVLPFVVLAAIFLIAFGTSFFIREPPSSATRPGDEDAHRSEQEPLLSEATSAPQTSPTASSSTIPWAAPETRLQSSSTRLLIPLPSRVCPSPLNARLSKRSLFTHIPWREFKYPPAGDSQGEVGAPIEAAEGQDLSTTLPEGFLDDRENHVTIIEDCTPRTDAAAGIVWDNLGRRLGLFLAQLHAWGAGPGHTEADGLFGTNSSAKELSIEETFTDFFKNVAATGYTVDDNRKTLLAALEGLERDVREKLETCIMMGSVLVNFENNGILPSVSVIDWEFVMMSPAFIDVGNFAAELFLISYYEGTDSTYATVLEAFAKAYHELGGPLDIQQAIRFAGAHIMMSLPRRLDSPRSMATRDTAAPCVDQALKFITNPDFDYLDNRHQDPFANMVRLMKERRQTMQP